MNDRTKSQPKSKPRTEWKDGAKFTIDGLTAVVSVTSGFRPRYSVQIGKLRDDGVFVSHIPIHNDGSFQVKVTPIAKILTALGEKVEEWISTELALRLDDRIEHEVKQSNFGRNITKVTGKTAKKKAKKLEKFTSNTTQ